MHRIAILMATAFVDMIGFAIVFPLLPFYAERMNATPTTIGLLIAAFSVAQLAASPMWGRFSDRFGRRRALLSGLAISAVAFTLFAFATNIYVLFLMRVVQGIGGATVAVAQAYVSDSTEKKDRARALGWLSAATSAGVMIGPAISSLTFSLGPEVPGLVAAGLCTLNFFFALGWLPESMPTHARDENKDRQPVGELAMQVLLQPRGDRARLIWIYAIGMLGFISMTAVLPLFLADEFGITERNIGYFFVFIGALSVVMRAVVLGWMVDRYGETRVMRMGAATLAIGLAAIPLPDIVFVTGLAAGLVPIGTALLFPSVSALVSHRTVQNEMGQTLGVQQTFGGVARVAAPIWATMVYEVGIEAPFFISGVVVAFVCFLTLQVQPEPEHEHDHEPDTEGELVA